MLNNKGPGTPKKSVTDLFVCDKAGNKSAMLFGVSVRAYGASAANQFLISLKSNRKDLINKVSQYKIPSIKITK